MNVTDDMINLIVREELISPILYISLVRNADFCPRCDFDLLYDEQWICLGCHRIFCFYCGNSTFHEIWYCSEECLITHEAIIVLVS